MGQSISTSIKKIVKEAMTSVDSISVQDAKSLVGNVKYQFVDVRERSEQQKSRRHTRSYFIIKGYDRIPYRPR